MKRSQRTGSMQQVLITNVTVHGVVSFAGADAYEVRGIRGTGRVRSYVRADSNAEALELGKKLPSWWWSKI